MTRQDPQSSRGHAASHATGDRPRPTRNACSSIISRLAAVLCASHYMLYTGKTLLLPENHRQRVIRRVPQSSGQHARSQATGDRPRPTGKHSFEHIPGVSCSLVCYDMLHTGNAFLFVREPQTIGDKPSATEQPTNRRITSNGC